jgi:hypothetical protein
MILQQESTVWLPTKFHGELPYFNGGDVETVVVGGVKSLLQPSQVPYYTIIKYILKYNVDGRQSVFFELLS